MTPAPLRQAASFSTANQHALATILEASQTKRIIASRDIFDIAGIKLWARDQPVSQALQRKLLDRQLRNPLETCLMAEDGVTVPAIVRAAEALLARPSPLAGLLQPHAARILREVAHLPLHAVPQLLLTAAQASRPALFDHAIEAMAVCGALMAAEGGSTAELRMALLAGLLHDLGEIYIDPRHGEAEADRGLDVLSYQQLVVHPHVGQLLITQLTNYPAALARAVAEHHERLDGSGYPHALQRDGLSPLGRLLAVAEATLGVLRAEGAHDGSGGLARASVALRVVPGEFDLQWVRAVDAAARAQPPLRATVGVVAVRERLGRLDTALQLAHTTADALAPQDESPASSPALQGAVRLSQHLLARLRLGWNASGLWSPEAVAGEDAAEVQAVEAELLFRLRAIERAARLRAGKLAPGEAARLDALCAVLQQAGRLGG